MHCIKKSPQMAKSLNSEHLYGTQMHSVEETKKSFKKFGIFGWSTILLCRSAPLITQLSDSPLTWNKKTIWLQIWWYIYKNINIGLILAANLVKETVLLPTKNPNVQTLKYNDLTNDGVEPSPASSQETSSRNNTVYWGGPTFISMVPLNLT